MPIDEKAFEEAQIFFDKNRILPTVTLLHKTIETYEAAKSVQPVGLSEDVVYRACKEYMRVTHPAWNPDRSLFEGGEPNWKLYADGIRAVLALNSPKRESGDDFFARELAQTADELAFYAYQAKWYCAMATFTGGGRSPTEEELNEATKIIEANRIAENKDRGWVLQDGSDTFPRNEIEGGE
jgi:hypothetical protein